MKILQYSYCAKIGSMIFLPSNNWEIQKTRKKGRGVFAKKDIEPGTLIGDYLGKVMHPANIESEKGDVYAMYYHDYASILPTNIAASGVHCINHSCTPNAWISIYKGHTLFFALRKIFIGEEITISYLFSPNECATCMHECKCESAFCTKTMHLSQDFYEKWRAFSEKEAKQTKRARIQYGKELPKLSIYPKSIPDNPIYTLFGNLEKPALQQNDIRLPLIKEIRSQIRKSGRILYFSKVKLKVFGVQNEEIITLDQPPRYSHQDL